MSLNSNKHHEHGNITINKIVTHRGFLCPWNTCITKTLRGRPFDSEGRGGGWHFLEINILTLNMLEINNLSSSGKKINNLTLTC